MKYFTIFILGAICMMVLAPSIETDITAHYTRSERLVQILETPNTDGMTKRVGYEIYVQHIFRAVISNEVIYATNEIDTGNAIIKTEPMDERRTH